MKIRTDFVTNSSSESTAEIVIENPVLLEILQKYKEMGAFGEKTSFGIGEFISDSKVSGIKTPAFHFCEELYGEGWATVISSPKSLDEVLEELIAIIDNNSQFDKELKVQMEDELRQKDAEIKKNYATVYWTNIQVGEEYPEVVGGKFTFDPENKDHYRSYSSAEVVIDNPILLEILQKYEDLGAFDSEYSDFSIGTYESYELTPPSSYEEIIRTPALCVGLADNSGTWGQVGCPSGLSDVVGLILKFLTVDESIEEEDQFEKMKAELNERHIEIIAAYKHVIWKVQDMYQEDYYNDNYEGYIDDSCEFMFDPMKGEEFHYIRNAGPGWDEGVEEGFIYGEKHIVNGKVLVDFGCVLLERSDKAEKDDDEEYWDEDDE